MLQKLKPDVRGKETEVASKLNNELFIFIFFADLTTVVIPICKVLF